MKYLTRLAQWIAKVLPFRVSEAPRGSNELTRHRQQSRADTKNVGGFVSLEALVRDADARLESLKETKFTEIRKAGGHLSRENDIAALVKHMGVFVVGQDGGAIVGEVEHPLRPQFLCVAMSQDADLETNNVWQHICWINKINRHAAARYGVQPLPANTTLYEFGIALPKERDGPSCWTQAALVSIDKRGACQVVRQKTMNKVKTRLKRGGFQTYHYSTWKSACLSVMRSDNLTVFSDKDWIPIFSYLMNFAMYREMHWCVTVCKDEQKICYSIPDNDAPRLFQKREKDGSRIFHAVKAHARRNGQVVRTHYRGNRHFEFQAWQFHIQMPGRHRAALFELPDFVEGNAPHRREGGLVTVADFAEAHVSDMVTR